MDKNFFNSNNWLNSNLIFDKVDDVHVLMKAYRKALGISQRKMGERLLCPQSTICRYETKQLRYLSERETNRILYNFSIDFDEVLKSRKTREGRILFCINVCISYLELTKDKKRDDYNNIVNFLINLSEDLRIVRE